MEYVNIVVLIMGVVATFSVVKYQSSENKQLLEKHDLEQQKIVEAVFKKLDQHAEDIVTLKTKQESNITAKEVHDQYISRELFEMHKQHIDHRFDQAESRFDRIDTNMGKLLLEIQSLHKDVKNNA